MTHLHRVNVTCLLGVPENNICLSTALLAEISSHRVEKCSNKTVRKSEFHCSREISALGSHQLVLVEGTDVLFHSRSPRDEISV